MATGNTLSTHLFAIDLGKFQVETVQDVGGLVWEQDVVEVRQVTPTGELLVRKQPGARKSGQITVTRGMDKSTAFTDWIRASLVDKDFDGARQDVTVSLMDPRKTVVRRVRLTNAFASRWEGPSLQAGGAGPAVEQVTIDYEDITVE
jgi:phage tail-like protein